MQIDISEIVSCADREMTTEAVIEMQSFVSRLGDFPITEKAPVDIRIANQENKRLLIRGDVNLTVSIPCGRCLEEVPTELRFPIDKTLRLDGSAVSDEEMEETDYLTGSDLDVDKLIYGEILVNWPVKVLCSEGCKGICKVCGRNLNRETCDCRRTEPDPRMAAIQEIFSKFKEV